jgi:polysaccharide chain length determinant protein (PEP-CTERM system associated)
VGAANTVEPPPNSLDARIRDHRSELDRLLLEYTEKHPDVIATRESLTRLEEQRARQLAALGVDNPDQEFANLDSNPIYQSIRMALNDAEVEIDALNAQMQERARRLEDLQALIDEVPQVEAELARLNRDYDVIYEQYQSLVRSRETQELSRKANDTDEVDFRVIDPPMADLTPVAPNRLLLFTAVFMLALGAGGGVCWLLAQIRPVFASSAELREVIGLPVIGAVTQAWERSYRLQRRWALAGFAGAMSGLGVIYMIVVAAESFGSGVRAWVGAG